MPKPPTKTTSESDEEITFKTNKWIQNVVIGLNMCPFAEFSMKRQRIFTSIVRGGGDGDDEEIKQILAHIVYESILRQDDEGTTLIICPDLYPRDFLGFYDIVAMAEDNLQDLSAFIQIAPFHPLFQFSGSGEDGVDNLTNRSPYPIFHILREEEVEAAVDKLDGDSSKVWQRNISLLEKMEEKYGRVATENIMVGEKVEGISTKDVLRIVREEKSDQGACDPNSLSDV